ncbi:MAG: sugar ABC transporter ATP-binding protein, partial [Vicinamibacteria bacterium]
SRARAALGRVGLQDFDHRTPVERLGLGFQQLIEIAKALAQHARVLILDEPTAALTDPQVETLFEQVRRLVQGGAGVLYVTHRLEEMRRIADRATVLRDGKVVASDAVSRLTSREIVRAMAGAEVERESKLPERGLGGPALRVERLTARRGRVRNVSFTLRRGEIFGLSGLVGSGRTSLLRTIFGADRAKAGGVAVGEGGALQRFREPREATRAGLGMIPEDRKRHGLLLPRSIELNVTLAVLKRIDRGSGMRVAEEALDRLTVQRRSTAQPVAELSGGNQQKVVVARWLLRDADVLLFDEPTRGIDASSRAAIYHLFHELTESGKAILLASSDLEELTSICDRIGVLSQGRLVGIFERGSWSREELTGASFQ